MDFSKYLCKDKPCVCGQKHTALVQDIVIKNGAIDDIVAIFDRNNAPKDILVIYDDNTYKAAGKKVVALLAKGGYNIKTRKMDSWFVHPDERAVGTVFFDMYPMPEMLLAVGSGSIMDLTRYCASMANVPYSIVGTAASMDGFVSTATPITKESIKMSVYGNSPMILIGDLDVIEKAPKDMLASGYGDMIGKITARLDWMLSNKLTGEKMCPMILEVADLGVAQCLAAVSADNPNHKKVVASVMNGLVLLGLAMQMLGDSRPASGTEHYMSHYLDMLSDLKSEHGNFHGEQVGVTSFVAMRLYQKFFAGDMPEQLKTKTSEQFRDELRKTRPETAEYMIERVPEVFIPEDEWATIKQNLADNWTYLQGFTREMNDKMDLAKAGMKKLDGYMNVKDMGKTKQEMRETLLFARMVRVRFTILIVLANFGLLEKYVDEVLDEIYG
jgi:glycerol-1-phosphate dehydrogenase [NAD(P)+]